jgi:hypothetical protein
MMVNVDLSPGVAMITRLGHVYYQPGFQAARGSSPFRALGNTLHSLKTERGKFGRGKGVTDEESVLGFVLY